MTSSAPPPPCRCTHALGAHEHYRPGEDCSLCGCRAYSPRLRDLAAAFLRRLTRKGTQS